MKMANDLESLMARRLTTKEAAGMVKILAALADVMDASLDDEENQEMLDRIDNLIFNARVIKTALREALNGKRT